MLIEIDDMKTHIYEGVMNAVTEDDDEIIQEAIDCATNEAKGYCSLYDVDTLFAGNPVDNTLKWHIKNMAKWHFLGLSNVQIDYTDSETRYNQAIKWLMGIQKGAIVPPGWPPHVEPCKATYFHTSTSVNKRQNHF